MALTLTNQQKADLEMVKKFLLTSYNLEDKVLFLEIFNKIFAFVRKIKEENGGDVEACQQFLLLHILTGSSGYEEIVSEFDMAGECSMLEFIKKLQEEYKDKL
jgi:hypothetical protein